MEKNKKEYHGHHKKYYEAFEHPHENPCESHGHRRRNCCHGAECLEGAFVIASTTGAALCHWVKKHLGKEIKHDFDDSSDAFLEILRMFFLFSDYYS